MLDFNGIDKVELSFIRLRPQFGMSFDNFISVSVDHACDLVREVINYLSQWHTFLTVEEDDFFKC